MDELRTSDDAAIERVLDFLRNLSLAQDRIAVVSTRNGKFDLLREDLETVALLAQQGAKP